ncbi:TfoX/Sxy family protein [Massilia endophytica]|nr:TfoX/Sxy family protein [Massilia endophytica]
MASHQSTMDFILDQMHGAGGVTAKKMFGEYGVYLDGKMFAVVCDDQLFMKPTAAGKAYIGEPEMVQPFPQAKPYFLIPGDQCEDSAWLSELCRITAAELPLPKPKKKK